MHLQPCACGLGFGCVAEHAAWMCVCVCLRAQMRMCVYVYVYVWVWVRGRLRGVDLCVPLCVWGGAWARACLSRMDRNCFCRTSRLYRTIVKSLFLRFSCRQRVPAP
jgi:hypothetical protein